MDWGEMALPLAALEDGDLDSPGGHYQVFKSCTAPPHRCRWSRVRDASGYSLVFLDFSF